MPAKTTESALSESQLMERVQTRFSMSKGWATFATVRNHRGFKPPAGVASRTLDGMSVGLWESLKGEVLGFECKSSRGDFQRELADPSKSDAFYRHCNRFWLVVGAADVATIDEVPMGWGLLVPRGDGLVEKKRAPRKKTDPLPEGIMHSLLHSVLRDQEAVVASARRCEREKADAEYQSGEAVANSLKELKAELETEKSLCRYQERATASAQKKCEQAEKALEAIADSKLSAKDLIRAHEFWIKLQKWPSGAVTVRNALRNIDPLRSTLTTMLEALEANRD